MILCVVTLTDEHYKGCYALNIDTFIPLASVVRIIHAINAWHLLYFNPDTDGQILHALR